MNYLVSGGAGFIGSHLTDRLLKDKNRVVVIDDLSEGKLENLPTNNKNLEFHKTSILDDIGNLFKHIDVVFHLGAITRPQQSIEEPEVFNRINVEGTLKTLINCKNNNVKRLVFASSASIYGEQDIFPTMEIAKPNPMSPYALTKIIGERYCDLFSRIYGLETICLRFFNVYGTRMNPDSEYAALIPGFIKKMKADIRPTIFGDGEQARDFVFIDDIIDGIVKASKCDFSNEIINLGSGENITVNKVAECINKLTNSKVKPVHGEPLLEPRNTLADISKAKYMLDWSPKTSLMEGIKTML